MALPFFICTRACWVSGGYVSGRKGTGPGGSLFWGRSYSDFNHLRFFRRRERRRRRTQSDAALVASFVGMVRRMANLFVVSVGDGGQGIRQRCSNRSLLVRGSRNCGNAVFLDLRASRRTRLLGRGYFERKGTGWPSAAASLPDWPSFTSH